MGPKNFESKTCWVKKIQIHKNFGSGKFLGQKIFEFRKKIFWYKNQDKFGPDKCYLDKSLKHLGSSYLCEFRLLAQFSSLDYLGVTGIDGLQVGGWVFS